MSSGHDHQGGGILPIFALSLLALIGVAALAVDVGHSFVNKTRLQNALDAAALAAAKNYDDTGNATAAAAEANAVLVASAGTPGNEELASALASMQIAVTFSQNLVPFSTVSAGPYVRVSATGFGSGNWFAQVAGFNRFMLSGSAVAGPSPQLAETCDVAPMMVCGDPASPPTPGGGSYYGYATGSVQMLKLSANTSSTVGPGNFELINLTGNKGGADIRSAMAGSLDACVSSGQNEPINTAPGNTVGPAVQGINTRFGIYQGPVSASEYPPDWVTRYSDYSATDYANHVQPTFGLDQYLDETSRVALNPPAGSAAGRRILRVPVGDCSAAAHGAGQVPLLGIGCFFLIEPAQQKGNDAQLFGQFKSDCGGAGVPGPNPVTGVGPHIIQLYHDPGSTES